MSQHFWGQDMAVLHKTVSCQSAAVRCAWAGSGALAVSWELSELGLRDGAPLSVGSRSANPLCDPQVDAVALLTVVPGACGQGTTRLRASLCTQVSSHPLQVVAFLSRSTDILAVCWLVGRPPGFELPGAPVQEAWGRPRGESFVDRRQLWPPVHVRGSTAGVCCLRWL